MNTNILLIILLAMIFCHIVDDYYLQGCLANLKQKSWWSKNAPDTLYKHDYIVALICHSFSWAFMITLPLTIYNLCCPTDYYFIWLLCAIFINLPIHAVVDDLKANKHKINLIIDQSIHLTQICITFLTYLVIFVK